MKRYTLNILEKSGCIKTGYEETLFGKTPDEVISNYLNYHREESFPDLEEKDIDCQENSWEGAKMRINLLYRRFDDNRILYAPELEMHGTKNVEEKCYPAVRVHPNFIDQAEYFFLLASEIGEYEERIRHPEKGFFFKELGGREKIEEKFVDLYEKSRD